MGAGRRGGGDAARMGLRFHPGPPDRPCIAGPAVEPVGGEGAAGGGVARIVATRPVILRCEHWRASKDARPRWVAVDPSRRVRCTLLRVTDHKAECAARGENYSSF